MRDVEVRWASLSGRLASRSTPHSSQAMIWGELHHSCNDLGTLGCGKCGRKILNRKRRRANDALAHILELD